MSMLQGVIDGLRRNKLPELCPDCGASLPVLVESFAQADISDENYWLAFHIAANCRTCRCYITAHFLGEERLAELLRKVGLKDERWPWPPIPHLKPIDTTELKTSVNTMGRLVREPKMGKG